MDRDKQNNIKDMVATPVLEISPAHLRLGGVFAKVIFVAAYPRYLASGWFSPVINLPESLDIAIHIHPVDTALALKKLRRKITQVESQLLEQEEKGLVRNPMLETAYRDIETLRDALQQSRENFFQVAVYLTLYADTLEKLHKLEAKVTGLLESRLIEAKSALFQQPQGFTATLPIGRDELAITSAFNSGPLSSFFPFISSDLTANNGILYGVNQHNNTLVIFDRFSLENANMVIFAKSGAGKSYATKLEALRLLMMGTDVIVLDPENEYESLSRAVGGSYSKISLASETHINPFDIPMVPAGEDPADVLKSHILNLTGLLKVMLGKITPEEEATLDRALIETYAARDIVPGKDFYQRQPPLMEDLELILQNLENGRGLAERLYRFTKGTYAGFINQPTNADIKNRFAVFSIRDLEDELRPIAMYIILNHLWRLVRAEIKPRVLIIDEAWWMMKYPDSAAFLFGLVKRCRKYELGITTITQDVEDFLLSPYGRPIITNSSLQFLLKQSPAMIELVAKTFNLTDSEKNFLLETAIGQGLFFAGLKHVVIQVVASHLEDKIITTKPEELI